MSYTIRISNMCRPEVADYARCAADGKTYKGFLNWMAEHQPQLRCGIVEYTIDPQSLDTTVMQPAVIVIDPRNPDYENGWRLQGER